MEPSDRLDRSTLALVAAAGVFDIIAFAVYAVGLEVAPTWLVGLASSFGPVIAVAYGISRLGERPRATQWLGPGAPGRRRRGARGRGEARALAGSSPLP